MSIVSQLPPPPHWTFLITSLFFNIEGTQIYRMNEPKIIVVTTANIGDDSKVHARNYHNMIQSIAKQTVAPHSTLTSVFSGNSIEDLGKTLECAKKVYKRNKAVSRFNQLKTIMDKQGSTMDDENTWLLFTDDDALWHEKRLEFYQRTVESAPKEAHAVAFPCETTYITKTPIGSIVNTEDVNRVITENVIKVSSYKPNEDHPVNFHDLCVRSKVLKMFLAQTPRELLCNAFCEAEFVMFTLRYTGKLMISEATQWLYFWRRADPSYVHKSALQLLQDQVDTDKKPAIISALFLVAEMSCVPCMKATANATLSQLIGAAAVHGPEFVQLVQCEYELAKIKKPWTQ